MDYLVDGLKVAKQLALKGMEQSDLTLATMYDKVSNITDDNEHEQDYQNYLRSWEESTATQELSF